MRKIKTLATLTLFAAVSALAHPAQGQSVATASQLLELSAFGAATGTFTDIEHGKNLGITAGVDLTYLPLRLIRPSIEIRGTYPIDKGIIDSQKNFLVGPKVELPLGRLHPYVNFLVGRGEIDYGANGFIIGDLQYISSISTIYSIGAGVDYGLTSRIAVKADAQYQHWDSPVVTSGTIHPVALSLGAVYRFNFNPRHHH